jgi:FHS family glucose/mannose:H+ symporter-like MFS transporter
VNASGPLALPGFLLSGFLFALLGALLPAWGYHLAERNAGAGFYFLCLGIGVVAASQASRNFVLVRGLRRPLVAACAIACVALAGLSFVPPPASAAWRLLGWTAIGSAAGLLNSALFEAIRPAYQKDPASTLTTGGIYFGLGCLASALLVAGTFYIYSVGSILLLSSAIPAAFAVLYWRRSGAAWDEAPAAGPPAVPGDAVRDFLSPGAVMFALLLFFQSGNEWAIAGWLPIFLIRRLGVSPESAIWMLAIYWLALLVGRVTTVFLLPAMRHGRLLFGSAGAALAGCLLLVFTDNQLGAVTGILLTGGGFAAIYPLVSEKIGHRFPYYHPGVFHSIFSLALAGGMLAPWMVGLLADWAGLWVVMGLPALGTLMVAILLLLIWLENKVTGR